MNSMDTDSWDQSGMGAFLRSADNVLLPKVMAAEVVVCIVPPGSTPDVKFAVELGLAISLGKPIILLVRPGTLLPPKLEQLADEIVTTDMVSAKHVQTSVLAAMDLLAERGVIK